MKKSIFIGLTLGLLIIINSSGCIFNNNSPDNNNEFAEYKIIINSDTNFIIYVPFFDLYDKNNDYKEVSENEMIKNIKINKGKAVYSFLAIENKMYPYLNITNASNYYKSFSEEANKNSGTNHDYYKNNERGLKIEGNGNIELYFKKNGCHIGIMTFADDNFDSHGYWFYYDSTIQNQTISIILKASIITNHSGNYHHSTEYEDSNELTYLDPDWNKVKINGYGWIE